MRITLAYNLRKDDTEDQAELLSLEDVDRLRDAIASMGHQVQLVEVSGSADQIVDALIASKPELIFNVAEGTTQKGGAREAFYPAIYEQLGIPYTGGGSSLLFIDLDKRLSEKLLAVRGIKVPQGALVTKENLHALDQLPYPLIIKPNFEGSSKGITQKSIVENHEEARKLASELIATYPAGLDAEEFVPGRELTVPMLESYPGRMLEIVEHRFKGGDKYNIYDYAKKRGGGSAMVETVCPPELAPKERQDVFAMADRVFSVMHCPDMGRVDIRLHENGTPYFIELNPLPSLHPDASLMTAARARGISFEAAIDHIIRSAALRYGLSLAPSVHVLSKDGSKERSRQSARELGLTIGRFPTGTWNAITDVEGVEVGHVTHIEDDVPVSKATGETTCIRTGVTAIVPCSREELFHQHLVSGGFVLNGIGEMSGLTQAMEWGWLETPILLTNTLSTGMVHTGIIHHMIQKYPELGTEIDVTIPVVAETNDGFLNDVRILRNTPDVAMDAIEKARSGPVEQGSVGGGTGMISFDFAGGIGSSSRRLDRALGGYTVGVLVQSNFGKMRNLTIDGAVVGRELDPLYPYHGRRHRLAGSVIVVVATDAPMLSSQLNHLSKRAALGLGRVGSYAASTSGEIVFAFSTGNKTSRQSKLGRTLCLTMVTDAQINALYEAVIEATEEAVLNAIFCSNGMSGKQGRYAPPLPHDIVLEYFSRLRDRKAS